MIRAYAVDVRGFWSGAWIVARREMQDQLRDWRILTPILILTLFFPFLMNFTARQAISFVARYGAPIIGERLAPFLLMVVGFFPISISLVVALETFAGERERLSLEPLLATPLSDGQLYLGKMLASLAPPLGAAYLGVLVYLVSLWIQVGWRPPGQVLAQVLLLTTAQAVVMVSGAVVISSQTTSVRAANLLASFIIIPVSQLIIGESLIMFWGQYDVLWWIIIGLSLLAVVLSRMGMHLFNREELLGREIDVLDLRWAWNRFRRAFVGEAGSIGQWYAGLLRDTLAGLRIPLAATSFLLALAFWIGTRLASVYVLPGEALRLDQLDQGFMENLTRFGMMSGRGWVWVFTNNLRAVGLATVLGGFSLGVLAQVLLMTPVAMTGYIAANLATAGQDTLRFLAALVLPHAMLEVPAALLAGAAILKLGLAAVSPQKDGSLGESWLIALASWARVSLGLVIPLLALAAFVEVFVTPQVALLLLSG